MGTITRSFANNITSGGTFDATDLTGTIPASNIADASVTNITAVPALTAVSTVASDPPSPDAGQVWYNTTDKALRGYVAGAGSWATGGNLNTAKGNTGTVGSQTAALAAAGDLGPAATTQVESYDGTSWTEITDVTTARYNAAAAGIQTSALIFSGNIGGAGTITNTESWNGSAWTELNDVN